MRHCVIIRGAPGAGKSTLAREYAEEGYVHLENDQYFYHKYGEYRWSWEEAEAAADWCFEHFKAAIDAGKPVVVSNTFTKIRFIKKYAKYAHDAGYNIEMITLNNNFGSIHNVPEETVKRMRNSIINHPVTLDMVLNHEF